MRKKAVAVDRNTRTRPPSFPKALTTTQTLSFKKLFTLRSVALLLGGAFVFGCILLFIGTQVLLQYVVDAPGSSTASRDVAVVDSSRLFPVGVDPRHKTITENSAVDEYFKNTISSDSVALRSKKSWLTRALGQLALFDIYQNLASPTGRILVIESGQRKEEIADNFAKILEWDAEARKKFLAQVIESNPHVFEGKFSPSTYTTARNASAETVSALVVEHFSKDVLSRYGPDIQAKIPLDQALTIASLLEREAYDFDDMREISGIIWNRLFINMHLQIDATLQYAKGTDSKSTWWPQVVPADKYIKSPFNTYKNKGLPPAPIANPSLDAILAALNPRKTDCMYYFHDKNAGFHCSVTYAEHVASLKKYYGQGK